MKIKTRLYTDNTMILRDLKTPWQEYAEKYRDLGMVINDEKGLTLEINLAGTKKEDIDIAYESDEIIVTTSKGRQVRKSVLETMYDIDKAFASYQDGLLKILVPKITKKKKIIKIG